MSGKRSVLEPGSVRSERCRGPSPSEAEALQGSKAVFSLRSKTVLDFARTERMEKLRA
jgi:hypothetical protein